MSLKSKRSPLPGLLPIPPFSDKGTVVQLLPYPSTDAGDVTLAMLGFYARNLTLIDTTIWTQATAFAPAPALIPAVVLKANLFGRDAVVVPNGAEWWALAIPDPAPFLAFPLSSLYRVRWELHV